MGSEQFSEPMKTSPAIFGLYILQPRIVPEDFFLPNTAEMARRFGLEGKTLQVACGYAGEGFPSTLIGTPNMPLDLVDCPVCPNARLRIFYNLSAMVSDLDLAMMSGEISLAGVLWFHVAMAFRGFLLCEGRLGGMCGISRDVFVLHGLDVAHDFLARKFLHEEKSPDAIRNQLDAYFVATYVRMMAVRWGMRNEPFDFDAAADIIKGTNPLTADALPVIAP
jgi:hypothetical protein